MSLCARLCPNLVTSPLNAEKSQFFSRALQSNPYVTWGALDNHGLTHASDDLIILSLSAGSRDHNLHSGGVLTKSLPLDVSPLLVGSPRLAAIYKADIHTFVHARLGILEPGYFLKYVPNCFNVS